MDSLNLDKIHDVPFEVFKKIEQSSICLEKNNQCDEEVQWSSPTRKLVRRYPHRLVDAAKCNIRRRRNLPLEVPSRASVFVSRPTLSGMLPTKARDPRFSNNSGVFKSDAFAKAYSFCDDILFEEKKELKEFLKKNGGNLSPGESAALKRRLDQLTSLEQRRERIRIEQDVKRKLRRKEMQLATEKGKKPFIHSKKKIKQLVQEHIYGTLKKTNKLTKYMTRKNKKLRSKEMRYAPSTRRNIDEIHDDASSSD